MTSSFAFQASTQILTIRIDLNPPPRVISEICGFGHWIRRLRLDGRPKRTSLCGFTKKSALCGQIPSLDLSRLTFLYVLIYVALLKNIFNLIYLHFVLQHSPHFLQEMYFLVVTVLWLLILVQSNTKGIITSCIKAQKENTGTVTKDFNKEYSYLGLWIIVFKFTNITRQ